MKLAGFVITAVVVGLSGPAFAQTGSGQQSAANPPATQAVANTAVRRTPRSWMASGFIGTNFGSGRSTNVDLSSIEDLDTNNSTSVNFGGQIGYLARGVIGGEFLMDFSPGLGSFDNLLFERSPDVNSYMFNLIAVAPFGHAQSYDPYVSGGIGAVTLNSTIFTLPTRLGLRTSPHSQPRRPAGRNSVGTSAADSWRGPKRTGASAATCGTTRPAAATLTFSI